MLKKFVILVFILFANSAISQNYQTVEDVNNACTTLGFTSNEDAEIAVDEILNNIGLSRNFVLVECPNINNAVAKNIDDGTGRKERYILYDNNFFTQMDLKAANRWAATSILAHEIGHHLNGHALNNEGSNHTFELEADEFSGFVLARMGATLEDALSAIKTLRYEKATKTHPAKIDRIAAIEKGWNRGAGHSKIIKENIEKIENPVNAEQVISNYIMAIGGKNNIGSVKTTSFLYNGSVQGMELKMTVKQKYPNKNYIVFESSGMILSKQVFNGHIGYTESRGNRNLITGDILEKMKSSSAFFNLDLGRTSKLIGIENFKGTETYLLTLKLDKYYFDKKTGFKIAEINGFKDDSGAIYYQTLIYKDYKAIDGLLYPHKIVIEANGTEIIFKLTEALINEGVSDSDFE